MKIDFRPHLWIPENEVTNVDNTPQSRSHDRGIDRAEHGAVLSTGLQEIMSAYAKLGTGDSLSDEDIRVFQLILPEGEKLADQKEFLEGEGMFIHMVKDERHAIVSTSKSKFDKLRDRVNKYRDLQRVSGKFQYIEGFDMVSTSEKKAASLKRYLEELGKQNIMVDIQIMFVPKLGNDLQDKAEQRLTEKIAEYEGTLPCSPYKLSDGTTIIRAQVPISHLDEIASDTVICRVEQTNYYTPIASCVLLQQVTLTLDDTVSIDNLPVVAVLDDGVEFPASLEPVIITHWVPSGSSKGTCDHGTQVAGKVAFANIAEQLSAGTMTPRARIIDCNVRDSTVIYDNVMIQRVREAIETFHDIAKVYNFSSSGFHPIDGDVISILGYEFDVLSANYGVKIVIAAGNHTVYRTASDLKSVLDDDEARISAPADSMLNITVGAIVGLDHKNSISGLNDVAPYSRIGPGFCGFRKPDVVAYGSTICRSGVVPPDNHSLMLGKGSHIAIDAGTSFTAPVVAGDLAEISQSVPERDILLSEALLYHGTEQLWDKEKLEKDEAGFLGDCYGRGLSSPITSKHSVPYRVTFLHTGELNRKTKQRVKFIMPSVLADPKSRKMKARIIVTCVTQAPIDKTKGAEYLGAYVAASLHKLDGKGKNVSANPSGADGRKKWDTCYHFEKELAGFSAGDWEIWLELFTRWDMDNEHNVEYALAVTIEDISHDHDIYNEVLLEAKGRFPAVNTVRLPVRSR